MKLSLSLIVIGLFGTVTAQTLSEELKLAGVAMLPQLRSGTIEKEVSTYDTTGGNNDGFAGTYSFIRRNPDSSLVIFDQNGPGVINRIWTPTPTKDTLDFYIDRRLAISICYTDLFSGKVYPFVQPLCGNAAGGYYCYFPILFQKHCQIVCRGHHLQFHQVQYRLYPKATKVTSFSGKINIGEKELLKQMWTVNHEGIAITSNGKLEIKKGGRITGVEVLPETALDEQAGIRINFDGVNHVDAKLKDFFGYYFGIPAMQSLLLGVKGSLHYCYFPMPFDHSANIELESFKGKLIVHYNNKKRRKGEGKFYAKVTADTLSENEPYHVFLDTNGEGHYVGSVLIAQGIGTDGTPFFEGDDITVVDGEMCMHGTGSEDYFNGGWYNIKERWDTTRCLPLHGCLGYSAPLLRTGGYRFYLSDKIPFGKSIQQYIEHGKSKKGAPAFYKSLAFYYMK